MEDRLVKTAICWGTLLLRPPYIGVPSYSDRLISGYRLIRTALYLGTVLSGPPYIGCRLIRTALYRGTVLFGPPYIGVTHYSDRLNGGPSY